jgi:protein-S-isoprenylcysteine O-methyltransferase Ste14
VKKLPLSSFLAPIGPFFFRYRNALFPLFFIATVVFSTPTYPLGSRSFDLLSDFVGLLIALSGQIIRALTVSYDYIERGGRNKQIYASRLVQGGMFGISRNPLYLGNGLIILGITLIVNAPLFYWLALPLTVLIYACIIAAEEQYLCGLFGTEYEDYCLRVNRLWPRWRYFSSSVDGMTFNWKRLISKEHNTFFALLLGLIFAELWSETAVHGHAYLEQADALILIGLAVLVALAYAVVHRLKKAGRFSLQENTAQD